MPTYEYRCARCQRRFERFQKITDPPRARCPECGGKAERVISGGGGLLFKGSGFYITDYRNPGYKEAEKKEKTAKAEGSKKGEAASKGETSTDASAQKTEARKGKK